MKTWKKAKVHLLHTNDPSQIWETPNTLQVSTKPVNAITNKHIYITTDEEIQEGDWYVFGDKNHKILQSDGQALKITNKLGKKIIATTDPDLGTLNRVELRKKRQQPQTFTQLPSPSQDWIKEYVKNPVEDIEVEYVQNGDVDFGYGIEEIPLINPDNTINIRSVKSNWSIEELEPKLYKLLNDFDTREYTPQYDSSGRISKRSVFPLNEWIKENL